VKRRPLKAQTAERMPCLSNMQTLNAVNAIRYM
jgi:hypothetical protein